MDAVSLTDSFSKNQTADPDTEFLINAIESLTSRALEETGQQWASMEESIAPESIHAPSVDAANQEVEIECTLKDGIDFEADIDYHDDKYPKPHDEAPRYYGSSGSSSNSFVIDVPEAGNNESIVLKSLNTSSCSENYEENDTSIEKTNPSTVINNISYLDNHIKSDTQRIIDNIREQISDSDIDGNSNNNRRVATDMGNC